MTGTSSVASQPLRGWSKAVAARNRTCLHRVAASCTSAVVFAPIIGPNIALAWLSLYMVVLGIEQWLVRPERGHDGKAPAGLMGFVTDCILFAKASVFVSIIIPLWFIGGIFGGFCAVIYIGAGLLQSIINGAGSTRVTFVTIAPTALAALCVPWLLHANGAGLNQIIAASAAVVVFLTICMNASVRLKAADEAQAKAYMLAERKRIEAEQSVDSRTAYLSMIAHDLRTPITAIMTGTHALKTEKTGDQPYTLQKLAMIEEAGLMMNALLNDLLDQARIDAGRMTLNNQAFDLRRLLSQTVRLWSSPIRAKGLRLVIEAERSLPRAVLGDEMRLRQVLNNLLSNAVKFTDQGTITLRASSFIDDSGNHAITIEVADTGTGMTRDQLSRMFNRFDQTADDIASRYGGSGLGLSICYDLVRLMDGRLTARSSANQGTQLTIALSLPMAEEAEAEKAPARQSGSDILASNIFATLETIKPTTVARVQEDVVPFDHTPSEPIIEASSATPSEAPLRVLVVDDHEINRRAIQLILQPFDCDITMAADGISALELTTTNVFDVIFMDVRMPELDGRETTRRLRAAGGPNVGTPVIAVTADNSHEDMSACLAAGMDGFVAKPLTPASLIDALQQTLDAHAERAAAAA